jgi:hypothetical protein
MRKLIQPRRSRTFQIFPSPEPDSSKPARSRYLLFLFDRAILLHRRDRVSVPTPYQLSPVTLKSAHPGIDAIDKLPV